MRPHLPLKVAFTLTPVYDLTLLYVDDDIDECGTFDSLQDAKDAATKDAARALEWEQTDSQVWHAHKIGLGVYVIIKYYRADPR